jgi:hypothetical protein
MANNQSNFGLDQCHNCGVRRKQVANPTTNYGFVLPTPTDLVTDLPADFDVALQGVDTQLKALQPGTTEGDLAYSSSTPNTNTRLAIGSTGNVLTVAGGVPTWAAPASGGGMTLLSTTTLSSTSTTISSIDQTYVNLFITFERVTQNTTGGYLRVNCNAASYSQYDGVKNGNGTSFVNSGSQTFFAPLGTNTPNSGYETFGQITIYNYTTTTTNSGKTILTTAYFDSPVAISSLKFDYSNGGTISGTIKIYGVK